MDLPPVRLNRNPVWVDRNRVLCTLVRLVLYHMVHNWFVGEGPARSKVSEGAGDHEEVVPFDPEVADLLAAAFDDLAALIEEQGPQRAEQARRAPGGTTGQWAQVFADRFEAGMDDTGQLVVGLREAAEGLRKAKLAAEEEQER